LYNNIKGNQNNDDLNIIKNNSSEKSRINNINNNDINKGSINILNIIFLDKI
jgi:CRISPR/Cas system-associated protein endoribonuclease Cas2